MNKERKYILIGGMVLLLIGAVYRFFPTFETFFPDADSVAVKRGQLSKLRAMVNRKDELQNALLTLNRELTRVESTLLSGGTPALSAVEIQNILNDIAETSRIKIETMRVLKPAKPEEEGGYFKIPVQITMNCNIRQLKDMIYRIETFNKALSISDIRIRLNSIVQLDKIQTTLTVEGFAKDSAA